MVGDLDNEKKKSITLIPDFHLLLQLHVGYTETTNFKTDEYHIGQKSKLNHYSNRLENTILSFLKLTTV